MAKLRKLKYKKRHVIVGVALILLLVIGVFVCRKVIFAKKMPNVDEVGILTTDVQVMDLQKSVSVTGSLVAGQSKSVTSTVATGTKVAAVHYEVGDYVEAGTVVVEFDADDYNTKLAQLNAKYNISDKKNAKELQSYLDQIEEYKQEIAETQEWLDENKLYYDNVKDAYEQYQKYPYEDEKKRYESQSSDMQTRYGFTMKDYESKQDSIQELQDKIEEAQYNYELAVLQQTYDNTYTKKEEYDQVTDSQSGTQVTAPISGYITAINVTAGNNYTQGNTVFTISNTDSFVVDATVDEYDIASLSEGLDAIVKFDATDDEEFTAKVTYVAVTNDSTTSSSSGTGNAMGQSSSSSGYEVKITLDGTDERLRVGMTAKASVILESAKSAFAVPYDCVETDKDGNSYITEVDDDNKETKLQVKLGLESDYYVQIISDDLKEGMKVKATASSGSGSKDSNATGEFPGGGDFGGGMPGGDFGGGAPGGGGFGGGAPGGF